MFWTVPNWKTVKYRIPHLTTNLHMAPSFHHSPSWSGDSLYTWLFNHPWNLSIENTSAFRIQDDPPTKVYTFGSNLWFSSAFTQLSLHNTPQHCAEQLLVGQSTSPVTAAIFFLKGKVHPLEGFTSASSNTLSIIKTQIKSCFCFTV